MSRASASSEAEGPGSAGSMSSSETELKGNDRGCNGSLSLPKLIFENWAVFVSGTASYELDSPCRLSSRKTTEKIAVIQGRVRELLQIKHAEPVVGTEEAGG